MLRGDNRYRLSDDSPLCGSAALLASSGSVDLSMLVLLNLLFLLFLLFLVNLVVLVVLVVLAVMTHLRGGVPPFSSQAAKLAWRGEGKTCSYCRTKGRAENGDQRPQNDKK